MRTPVKLPGPMPTASTSRSRGCAPPCPSSASTSASSVAARHALAEHLAVVDERARRQTRLPCRTQRQHSSIGQPPLRASTCRKGHERPAARGATRPALRPLHEGDRAVEVRLEVAPLLADSPANRYRSRCATAGPPGSDGRSCTSGSSRARSRRAPWRRRARTSSCRPRARPTTVTTSPGSQARGQAGGQRRRLLRASSSRVLAPGGRVPRKGRAGRLLGGRLGPTGSGAVGDRGSTGRPSRSGSRAKSACSTSSVRGV